VTMPENKAAEVPPAQEPAKTNQPKMVPEADLLRLKKGSEAREKKYREELANVSARLREVEAKSILGGLNTGDEADVGKVKSYLLGRASEIEEKSRKLDEELASLKEREREVRVKDVALRYGLSSDELAGEEDVESAALRLRAERLSKENEELKKQSAKVTTQPVYENNSSAGVVRKSVNDMNNKELADYEKELKARALSRK
jgi:hypothetical protein